MGAFLLGILKNLLISAALAFVSSLFYRQKSPDPPEPQENDFAPSAAEGTEIPHLFGTGPIRLLVVGVFDRATEAIKR